ncbi:DUF3164 family protein [Bacteroides thetaiotaomicron]|jgi:hypothetical protein|uniref:DUF3164 family protein n=1 Tax=Bacteroides thetaiotaomicron TaxID=818 RepID=UPI0039C1E223
MDISNLSKEEKAKLKMQLEAEDKAERARIDQERQNYKDLVDVTVNTSVKKLQELSAQMERLKNEIFSEFDSVIKMKEELFNVKIDRQTDTFTTSDSRKTITIGNRINEGWDDTVEVGISMVKRYMSTMAKDENSAALVDTVMSLLAKNRKGALKANKVLELEKLANKTGDKDFIEAIKIIRDAYHPVPTCQFIEVELKNEEGNPVRLPLSMSAI